MISKTVFNMLLVKRAILTFCILSIIFWSYFISTAELKISNYGLISSTNLSYFAATFLMVLSITLLLKYDIYNKLYFLQLFSLYVMLYLSPFLLEKTASFTYSYLTYGYMDYITRTGHMNTILLPYQNWPGIMFFGSILTLMANLDMSQFLILYPVIMKLVSLIFIYLIFSVLANGNIIPRFGILVYLLGDWTAHLFYTPPSFAIIILLLIDYFILYILFKDKVLTPERKIVIIILSASIIISHLLSSIVAFLYFFVAFICLRLNKSMNLEKFILLSSTLLLTWNFFQVGRYFSAHLAGAISNFLNIKSIVESTDRSSMHMGSAHTELMYIKIFYITLFSLLAILGILYTIIDKKRRTSPNTIIPIGFLFLNTIIIPLVVGPYSGEIMSRAFGYDAIFLTFFIAMNWNKRLFNGLILCFLLVSPILFFTCSYGNEAFDYVSPTEIASMDFYYKVGLNKEPLNVLGERAWSCKQIEEHRWKPLEVISLNNSSLFIQENNGYVVFDERSITGYSFLMGNINKGLISHNLNRYYNCIYSSSGSKLFYLSE